LSTLLEVLQTKEMFCHFLLFETIFFEREILLYIGTSKIINFVEKSESAFEFKYDEK